MKRTSVYLTVNLLLPCVLTAQAPQMHPDHPNVRADLVPPILEMKSGIMEGEATLPWRLFVPEITSPAARYPLVVVLHGAGSRGDDNVRPMALFRSFWDADLQTKHPAFILAPQMKDSWVTHRGKFTNFNADEYPVAKEMLTLIELVEQLINEYPIDSNRVYIIGASMGGYGTWDAITRRPDIWAAAVPICGGGDPAKAPVFKHIPIWAWHGSNDTTVPPENTRAIIEAIQRAGGTPKYSEPKTDHGSWNNAFADPELYNWLFGQTKSESTPE